MFLSVLPVLLTALKRGRLPCNKVKTSYSSLNFVQAQSRAAGYKQSYARGTHVYVTTW